MHVHKLPYMSKAGIGLEKKSVRQTFSASIRIRKVYVNPLKMQCPKSGHVKIRNIRPRENRGGFEASSHKILLSFLTTHLLKIIYSFNF